MLAALAGAALAQFGNQDTPFDPEPGPFIALLFLGFVVAVVGHVIQSRGTVTAGIVLIFASTLLLPLVLYLSGGG